MGLSCECDSDGDYAWFYRSPDDFSIMDRRHAKPCSSCGCAIFNNAIVLKFECVDIADNPIAPKYLCEKCGDLYLSLDELGFCNIAPDQSMSALLAEYHEHYGRKTA